MEKRFILFFVLAFAILIGWEMTIRWLYPPPPKPPQKIAQKDDKDGKQAKQKETPKKKTEDEPQKQEDEPEDAGDKPQPAKVATERVTLGSADPDSGYHMLVTFVNRGAAIERIELNDPRYEDLDDRYGYLGNFAPVLSQNACKVQVVGPGTPAAKAGLQAGDLITQINDQAVKRPADLDRFLRTTEPGEKVTLQVTRPDSGKTLTLTATLGDRPLQLVKPETSGSPTAAVGDPTRPKSLDPLSLLFTLDKVDDKNLGSDKLEHVGVDLRDGNWSVGQQTAGSVEFEKEVPKFDLKVVKRYRIFRADKAPEAGYGIKVEIEIHNLRDQERLVAYRLDGPTGLPTEGYWYAIKVAGGGIRDVVVRFHERSQELINCTTIAEGDQPEQWLDQPLDYIGVDAQYFAAILIPEKKNPEDLVLARSQAIRAGPPNTFYERLTNVTVRLVRQPESIPAGGSVKHGYMMFAGPKDPDVLAYYGLEQVLDYGYVDVLVRPLLWVLHSLYGVIGNYGLSIILMTVMVRLLMHPLSRVQTVKMQEMQERSQKMQPEMQRIQEKYKNDPEGLQRAQVELFKKHNPMAGCFSGCSIVLLQLPIFWALFSALRGDIQLRGASLLGDSVRWCSNLAAPDMLFYWGAWMPTFFTAPGGYVSLGPYFNILPVVSALLILFQQRRMMANQPPPTDEKQKEQQEVTRQMMSFMTLFMGFIFFKMPSGLCLYFVTSSFWGMAERKLLPKKEPSQGGDQPPAKAAPPPKENQPGFLDNLLDKLHEKFNSEPPKKPPKGGKKKSKRRRQRGRK